MGFKINNDEEMDRLLTGLANDIVDAHVHYKMHDDLITALQAAPEVARESNNFWHMTISAHVKLSQAMLTRAYDQEHQSLHLKSWLIAIRDNPDMFSAASFRERMKENPYVDSLAEDYRIPDRAQLEADIVLCSSSDPLVRILMYQRNNCGAHLSAKLTAAGVKISDQFPLTYADFKRLLERSLTIIHRYSTLFVATSYSTNVVGRKDFETVFVAVKRMLEQNQVEKDAFIAKAMKAEN
ncbi:AbiU2 domain-containing protein [Massilia sp. S19_KUP03_FR1]|uniref:AbiU2 domain-containing protein n=1 Tax=Massilia sp. S19_KUP03_FR1 TaxID=3025503 RepID=UPI002FCD28B6